MGESNGQNPAGAVPSEQLPEGLRIKTSFVLIGLNSAGELIMNANGITVAEAACILAEMKRNLDQQVTLEAMNNRIAAMTGQGQARILTPPPGVRIPDLRTLPGGRR